MTGGARETGGPALAPAEKDQRRGRHSAHSGTMQQGAHQPADAENLRETNVQQREENPKTSPKNLINTFCGAP